MDMAVEANDSRVQLREIAARQEIPEKYLEQVLRPLKNAGVVASMRGSRGGYRLAKEPEQVTALEVLEAVEGPLEGDLGVVGSGAAGEVVKHLWAGLMSELRLELGKVTVAEMAASYRRVRDSGDDWVI
jgi:Rrf2 family protein